MKTFAEALKSGFRGIAQYGENYKGETVHLPSFYVLEFGDNGEYELCFEPLLFGDQWYVGLYKNGELLTDKVVVKPGYVKETYKSD